MTTLAAYDASTDFDLGSSNPKDHRARFRLATLSLLSAALLALLGAMVARTVADTPTFRMGTSR